MPRDVHSDDVDRRPLGTRQSCLQKEAVCGEAADNPCRVTDVSWSSDDIEIPREDAPQVTLIEDDDVIQAFAADRADGALDIWILPW